MEIYKKGVDEPILLRYNSHINLIYAYRKAVKRRVGKRMPDREPRVV